MIKFFKKINLIFVDILLIFFYFLIIGMARIIYLFTYKEKAGLHSYWKKPDGKKLDVYSSY